jgi:hypothetical protein
LSASRACNAAVRCAVNCSISATDIPAFAPSGFTPSGAFAFAAFFTAARSSRRMRPRLMSSSPFWPMPITVPDSAFA